MKQVLYFYMDGCPFCRQADGWMREVLGEHPEFAAVEIKKVEERRERAFAESYDYYFVPTYYVDGVKVHEGVASKRAIESVFQRALS